MIQTIDITRALKIEGWMSEPELVWLAERAVEHRCIVEIGSYLGRSTRALLDHTPGIVYAIDDWKGPRDVYMDKEERNSLYERFCSNVQDHINSRKCHVIRTDHKDIQFYKTNMVFLDGSHEYEDVKRDIEFWKPKILPDGLLCGHDADWSTVQQAVVETLGDVEPQTVPGTEIWYTEI